MSSANMSEPLSVLIVGCGDIAGGYDERGSSGPVLTHASAYIRDPRFRIRACVEPDPLRRAAFMEYWGVENGYQDLQTCLATEGCFDVASLCLPTALHGEALEVLLAAKIRLVFAEKPLTGNAELSHRIVDAYEAAGCSLAVNYSRRWDRRIGKLKDEIAAGEWGSVQAISGLYAKGLFNNGSHFFDCLHFLIGPLVPRAVLGRVDDGRTEDPTLSVFLESEIGTPVILTGVHGGYFFPFEIDIVMEKGRITLEDLGGKLRCRRVSPHPLYVHQPTLDDGTWEDTKLAEALVVAVDNIFHHLASGAELLSTGRSVLAVEDICTDILKLAVVK